MNYNNYYGNPYGQYTYTQPQTNYTNYQSQLQPQQQVNLYAFVDGLEGAKAYQVKPNTMMLLMDSQQPICYKKQVNSLGQTVDFQVFDLVPHQEKNNPQVEYVPIDIFNEEINALKTLINDMKKVNGNG